MPDLNQTDLTPGQHHVRAVRRLANLTSMIERLGYGHCTPRQLGVASPPLAQAHREALLRANAAAELFTQGA